MCAAAAVLAVAVLVPGSSGAQDGGYFSSGYNFLKAVKDRDVAKANDLSNAGPTLVNTRDLSSGETALHFVTRDRDGPWMRYLIEKGADVNQRDKEGVTPLIIAAEQRYTDGVRLLLAAGADVNLANRNGETPLIKAVHLRDQTMVRLLVDNGADPRITDSLAGYSALDYAERDPRSGPIAQILKNAPAQKAAPKPPAG